jgi:glycosyltransferase involved in cell wall biosynthesis
MTEAGHHVHLIAGRGEQTDERIPFIRVPRVDSLDPEILGMKGELNDGKIPAGFDDLVDQLAGELTDVLSGMARLIAHNVCSLNKNLPLTAALHKISEQRRSPQIILWHHDLAWTTPRYRQELHDRYPWNLLKTAWTGVMQVTISDFRRAELAALFQIPASDIHVVPNGVDQSAFLKLERQTQEFVERLHLDKATPLLILPVRITPRKNIELALRVMAELRRTFPGAALVVTGPLGPHNPANRSYFNKLVALRSELGLQNAAHFLAEHSDGPVPDAVISDLYRLADALLLPSREEGFGIPVLEAGLVGIPVFCADIPPLRELGAEYVDYFPPEGAPEEIAHLIERRLEEDRVFLLRQRVHSHYLWEPVYRRYIAPLLEKG